MPTQKEKLERAKRSATLHILFKCSRLLNEKAVATLPRLPGGLQPRTAHLSLFPHIDLETGTRISELAERLGISHQAVGQLVDDLEQMGAVARSRDPRDGRAKLVVFTPAGKQSMLDGLEHLRALESKLTKAVGKQTMTSLRAVLLTLHDHLTAE